MRSFASIAQRSAAPQNERDPDSNTKNATHDLEQQLTPRLDWSFRDIASGRTLPKLSFSSLSRPAMQRKLLVNEPGDQYEQEADRVAEQVMGMPELDLSTTKSSLHAAPVVQRKCAQCEEKKKIQRKCAKCEDEEKLQRKGTGDASPESEFAPPIVNDVLNSAGQPLDSATRAFFEPRFNYDFSRVRIHADPGASHAANAVQALAFTVGRNIVFGSGRFAPPTPEGRKLLAHELTHVVQQRAAPAATTHSQAACEGATTSQVSEPGQLQRQPKGGKDTPKTEACPPMEAGEREEAAKAHLRLVERIPQQEWLIYGFPIGGTEIAAAETRGFISTIVRSLMQGHPVYITGQDSLEVLGFSDCFAGPQVDNHRIRQLRSANFCAGVKDHYASTPNTYPALIRSCDAALADQYVGSNASRADRAQNRSILIRRVTTNVQFREGNQSFPFNPKYGPSEAHCAAYSSSIARDILGPVYTNNAHCSCLVTPDEPHNNCVRHCLQDKMWTLLANASPGRKPNDPPVDINIACPLIWKHHRDCYHDCGCASEFIDFLAFDAVCNIALPCAVDSAAINLLNRCMPATKNDKYLPVD
ncbi:MAG: DUF4157 domain-containing protein [Candidatus Sulfotelmatobacter sp.]